MERKNNMNNTTKGKIVINNTPDNADHWIVARIDGSDLSLWYWGSWPFDAYEVAKRAAQEINGIVLENVKEGAE